MRHTAKDSELITTILRDGIIDMRALLNVIDIGAKHRNTIVSTVGRDEYGAHDKRPSSLLCLFRLRLSLPDATVQNVHVSSEVIGEMRLVSAIPSDVRPLSGYIYIRARHRGPFADKTPIELIFLRRSRSYGATIALILDLRSSTSLIRPLGGNSFCAEQCCCVAFISDFTMRNGDGRQVWS